MLEWGLTLWATASTGLGEWMRIQAERVAGTEQRIIVSAPRLQ